MTAAPAALSTRSISRLPPRTFWPFASSGSMIGLARPATPPACQIQVTRTTPFSASASERSRPTSAFFQESACS